jgi:WD40 repeat protein
MAYKLVKDTWRPGRAYKTTDCGEVAFSPDGARLAVTFLADVTTRTEDGLTPEQREANAATPKTGPISGLPLPPPYPPNPSTVTTNHYAVGLGDLTAIEKLDTGSIGTAPATGLGFSVDGKDVLVAQGGSLTAHTVRPGMKGRPLGVLDGRVAGDPLALARAAGVTVTVTGPQAVTGWMADDDGTPTKQFDLPTPGDLHTVAHAGASADGTRVVTAHEPAEAAVSRVLRVWDRSGAEPVVVAEVRAPHAAAVTGLVVAADGTCSVTTAADGSVHLWRIPAAP